jgi:nicotinamidase/pyrazinamidase
MPKRALIAVDVQNDFLPGGALPAADGNRIIHPITLVARDSDLVIASRDWHPPDHISFETFGPHCVQKTPGARIHSRIRRLANFTVSKGMDPDQDAFSAFQGRTLRPSRTLESILRRHGINQVIVTGLVLDICVRHTALDANALGFDTIVPLDCTAALSEEDGQKTLDDFRRAGVRPVEHWQA